MLGRLNFLFSVSLLTLLLFYVAGRFAILKLILAIAPALAPYFIAAYTLVALMLTVLVVAKTANRLGTVSTAARGQDATGRTFAAQGVLCLAHMCTAFAIYNAFANSVNGTSWWPWLVAVLLYASGIRLVLTDMRTRAAQVAA